MELGLLEPKNINCTHKIMILANWAHFRPTLVNWVLKKDYYLHI